MSQAEEVLDYIHRHGVITPREVMLHLDIYRLAARVYDLRRHGDRVQSENRWTANGRRYVAYWIEGNVNG